MDKKLVLGHKVSMTQFYDDAGNVHPATIVSCGPMTVTDIKTVKKDGYAAVQYGFGTRKAKNVAKAQTSAWKDLGVFETLKEVRSESDIDGVAVGDTLTPAEVLEEGDVVNVTGVSKGKGFQGVVKRHNFGGGRRSHGQKHSEREPGSIGATGPARVFKGTKMAGRMGGDRILVKNLKVLAIDPAQHVVVLRGALPGRRGTLVEIVKNA